MKPLVLGTAIVERQEEERVMAGRQRQRGLEDRAREGEAAFVFSFWLGG